MNISDSFLKAQLQSVFWIGGGGYGGKTTITVLLADKHGFVPYHPEDHFGEHKKAASPEENPSLLAPFHGWEWFFNRPIDEYIKAINDSGREQFEMVLLDLVKMSADSKVVADVFFLDPRLAERLTEYKRSIFLYADEEVIRRGFFARADKQDLLRVINSLAEPVKTREYVLDVTCTLSARKQAEAEAAGMKVLVRNTGTDLQETLAVVEKHFGLACPGR
jgi:hypothetical protein